MKKIIAMIFLAVALCACVKPDVREHDSSTALRALKAFVYTDENDLSVYEEFDLLSGMYLEEQGLATYTFPKDAACNASTLSRCRLEATVPNTASLEMLSENGHSLGKGLEGWHNLYNTTIYFKVVADSGDIKNFSITCRCIN